MYQQDSAAYYKRARVLRVRLMKGSKEKGLKNLIRVNAQQAEVEAKRARAVLFHIIDNKLGSSYDGPAGTI